MGNFQLKTLSEKTGVTISCQLPFQLFVGKAEPACPCQNEMSPEYFLSECIHQI